MRSVLALLRLSPKAWLKLGGIALTCLAVELGLRLLPVRRLMAWLAGPARPGAAPDPEMLRFAAAVFRRYPLPLTCLKRSLILWALLHRRGVPVELKIGLAKHAEVLQAHAWVEHQRRVLWDDPAVAGRYAATLPLRQAG